MRAKEFLRRENVPFVERDVSRDPAAAREMVQLSGQRGVPVIAVDGQAVVGFDAPRLKQLLANRGARGRGGLGLRVKDVPGGVLVGGVRAGSRGERAGLRAGDLIEAINGLPVRDTNDLERVARAGTAVRITIRRDGQRQQLSL